MRASETPNITRTVRAVIRDVAKRLPEYAHIRASRILVVAGEARRASRATVRPLHFPGGKPKNARGDVRPEVRFQDKKILYVITLRPNFFRDSTPETRVATILHELFHISKRFDGTLHAGRRHSRLGKEFDKRLRPLVTRYLDVIPEELYRALAFHGLVKARQWLEKPGAYCRRTSRGGETRTIGRKLYSEKQMFLGPVQMITRPLQNGPKKKVFRLH